MTCWFSLWPHVFQVCPTHFQLALAVCIGNSMRFVKCGLCITSTWIKWTSRPFIPLSEQFTRLANTVENENPVQPRILCCKQGTSLQELSSIVRLAGIEWFGHWYTISYGQKAQRICFKPSITGVATNDGQSPQCQVLMCACWLLHR